MGQVNATLSVSAPSHVDDVGTIYSIEVRDRGIPLDLTDATVTKIFFETPTGTIERTAEVETTGEAEKERWYLVYTTDASDITDGLHAEAGDYRMQGYVEFDDGSIFRTGIHKFVVEDNLTIT